MYCLPKFGQLILTKIIKIVATICEKKTPFCSKNYLKWLCDTTI